MPSWASASAHAAALGEHIYIRRTNPAKRTECQYFFLGSRRAVLEARQENRLTFSQGSGTYLVQFHIRKHAQLYGKLKSGRWGLTALRSEDGDDLIFEYQHLSTYWSIPNAVLPTVRDYDSKSYKQDPDIFRPGETGTDRPDPATIHHKRLPPTSIEKSTRDNGVPGNLPVRTNTVTHPTPRRTIIPEPPNQPENPFETTSSPEVQEAPYPVAGPAQAQPDLPSPDLFTDHIPAPPSIIVNPGRQIKNEQIAAKVIFIQVNEPDRPLPTPVPPATSTPSPRSPSIRSTDTYSSTTRSPITSDTAPSSNNSSRGHSSDPNQLPRTDSDDSNHSRRSDQGTTGQTSNTDIQNPTSAKPAMDADLIRQITELVQATIQGGGGPATSGGPRQAYGTDRNNPGTGANAEPITGNDYQYVERRRLPSNLALDFRITKLGKLLAERANLDAAILRNNLLLDDGRPPVTPIALAIQTPSPGRMDPDFTEVLNARFRECAIECSKTLIEAQGTALDQVNEEIRTLTANWRPTDEEDIAVRDVRDSLTNPSGRFQVRNLDLNNFKYFRAPDVSKGERLWLPNNEPRGWHRNGNGQGVKFQRQNNTPPRRYQHSRPVTPDPEYERPRFRSTSRRRRDPEAGSHLAREFESDEEDLCRAYDYYQTRRRAASRTRSTTNGERQDRYQSKN